MSARPADDRPLILPLTRREVGGAALLLGLAVTLFLSPALFTGRFLSPADLLYSLYPWQVQQPAHWAGPSNSLLSDSVLVFEPWLLYSAQRLHEGGLPLWNPNNMLGAPLIGNMQSAIFYPFNWPAFLWPGGAFLVLRAWLTLFLAGLGMYLLARQVIQVGRLGAAIAALSFAFGAYMITWLLYPLASTAAWLPWLWWATGRLVAQPGRRAVAALAGIVGLSLFAGHAETAYYSALGTGLFVLFQVAAGGRRPIRWVVGRLGGWVAAYLLGACVAAVALLPFVEYLLQSTTFANRSVGGAEFWLPFRFAWTLLSPDLYGNPVQHSWWDSVSNYNEGTIYIGLLPLLLAPFAVFAPARAQRRLAWFLLGIIVVALGVVYHWPLIYEVATALPLMRFGANIRLVLLLEFALGLLAAVGIDTFVARLPQWRRLGLGLVLITLIWGAGGIALPWMSANSYFQVPVDSPLAARVWQAGLQRALVLLLITSGLLALLIVLRRIRGRLHWAALGLLPLALLADLGQVYGSYNPTIAPADYYPPTPALQFLQRQQAQADPFRTVAIGSMFLPEANLAYGLANLAGYDAVEPHLYRDLITYIDPALRGFPQGLLIEFSAVQSRVLNLLNVRYVLAPPGTDPNYLAAPRQDAQTGDIVGEIRGGNRPGQTFVAERDNLTQIQVLGANFGHPVNSRLIFHLKTDPAAPADLVTQEIDTSPLGDDAYWSITFPPIPQSNGRQFYFYFEAPRARTGLAVTLWYSRTDVYPPGTRMENGKPAPGDLTFRALYLLDAENPWFVRVLDGGNRGVSIFENRQALPRAWLTHQVELQSDATARLRRLRDPNFDRAGTALLAAPLAPAQPLPAGPPDTATDKVTITRYAPETVEIGTTSAAPGILILADQAFPGWQATVDGQQTPILTVDHALRGIYLTPGVHAVRFEYAPVSFRAGLALTGGGLLVLVLLVVGRRKRAPLPAAPGNPSP